MIDILNEYKGKVVTLCLKNSGNSISGIIDKINIKNRILTMQSWQRYVFIDLDEIAVIMEISIPRGDSNFDDHVVPNVFT